MINNIMVGPPIQGAPGLKVPDKESKAPPGSDSFGRELDKKMSKAVEKEARREEKGVAREKREPELPKKAKESDSSKEEVSAKPNSRKQAIKKFMDSFESELGIPATRLVESIAKLESTELELAPEATAEAVVSELGLDAQSEQKAMAMYAAMLAEVKAMPTPVAMPLPETAPKGDSALAAIPLKFEMPIVEGQAAKALAGTEATAMSADLGTAAMADSQVLKNMKFAEASPETVEESVETGANVSSKPLEASTPSKEGNNLNLSKLQLQSDSAMNQAALASLVAKAQQQAKTPAASAEEATADSFADELALGDSAAPSASAQLEKGLDAQKALQQNKMAEMPLQLRQLMDQFRQQGGGSQQQLGSQGAGEKALGELAEGAKDVKATEFKSTLDSLSPHLNQLKAEPLKVDSALVPGTAAPVLASPADNEANVKQILSQAQILMKKGGGEMNVKMTPEGLGEVHLKVLMQDGKMNLQLHAESKEAKQAIESSLAELKTSLAAHKLSVDHVKVDVVSSTNTENSTNSQSDMNSQQNPQDQAKKFWNQFNENFGSNSRRDSFFNSPSGTGYGFKKPAPLQPIETGAPTIVAPTAREGRGQGLNLVA